MEEFHIDTNIFIRFIADDPSVVSLAQKAYELFSYIEQGEIVASLMIS